VRRFEFRLERVRQWRETELETERAKLAALLRARQELESQLASLRMTLEQAERAVLGPAERGESIRLELLVWITAYRRWARQQEQLITGRLLDLDRQLDEQRQRVLETWRRYELLNRLRSRAWMQWLLESDRELERQASELTLIRWSRLADGQD